MPESSTQPNALDRSHGSPVIACDSQVLRVKPALENAILVALLLLTLLLYGKGWTYGAGEFSDASHHLMNGIFVHDAVHHPVSALSDPVEFVFEYYRHYPAVNIGYYPPVFPIIEASFMLMFGASGPTAQLAVLLMSLLMTFFSFKWFRLRFSPWWAAAATVLLVANPLLVYWGRDIMIEVPVLAFLMGAIWTFEKLLQSDTPSWRGAIGFCLLTILAIWTKQHALMLLPVFLISTLTTGRWRHLLRGPIITAISVIVLAAGALVYSQLKLGGDAVGHSLGFTAQHVADRFNYDQWLNYVYRLPFVASWPILIAGLFGTAVAMQGRLKNSSVLFSWIAVFYLMHSYMKAQDVRYALLWLPPFCALAMAGAQGFTSLIHRRSELQTDGKRLQANAIVAACLVVFMLYQGNQVKVPRVPSAYQRAASDLSDKLGEFTCLVSIPERASRMAVFYRLAVQEKLSKDRDIFSFGRIIRANQLLRDWKDNFGSAEELAKKLKSWNVKYVLRESPSPLNEQAGQVSTAEALDALLAQSAFRAIRTYPVEIRDIGFPVKIARNTHPHRTITLYERIEPMGFNPNAAPTIKPRRVPVSIHASKTSN